MHVISYRSLREYARSHSDCNEPLDSWYKVASKANWSNLLEVQSVFPSAEAVGNFTVFNIKGNDYRLVVAIDYDFQVIFIRYIGTHKQYNKIDEKNKTIKIQNTKNTE